MANLFSLKKQHADALNKVDAITLLAANANRQPTATEEADMSICMSAVEAINPQIHALEQNNTLAGVFSRVGSVGLLSQDSKGIRSMQAPQRVLSADYYESFYAHIASKGARVDAALYEGSDGAGGYAVPIVVSDQIVPLAPNEMAVRRLAQVIPTTSDIKVPSKLAFGTAAINAELGTFAGTAPTLEQFTLSAFMSGVLNAISWELAQDVPAFQSFVIQDMILAQQMLEENL
jgi:HK97 family phage major capsid protein